MSLTVVFRETALNAYTTGPKLAALMREMRAATGV